MATKKSSTPEPQANNPAGLDVIEPARIAPHFVDMLAAKGEEELGQWLKLNVPENVYWLWSNLVWLNMYVQAATKNNGSVDPFTNREILDRVADVINGAIEIGADFRDIVGNG